MHSDPVADLATRIRNSARAGNQKVNVLNSKLNIEILKTLQTELFIKSFCVSKDDNLIINVDLLEDKSSIQINRISKPGRRVYKKSKEIKPVLRGLGIFVVSTSRGVMPGYKAYKQGVGGEILLEVY